jgi:hypothetical protein
MVAAVKSSVTILITILKGLKMAATYETPTFYDSINQVVRTMDPTAYLPPLMLPISATSGNIIQALADGLYVGSTMALPAAIYVNTATGVNAPGNGTLAMPYQTLDYAVSELVAASVNQQLQTSTLIALQAGQTFTTSNNINLYGGTLTLTFYGDPNYGSYNSPLVMGTTDPWLMTNLERPVIEPQVTNVNGYWDMAGINVYEGNVILQGVEVMLPMAPEAPSITLYSNAADYVRAMDLNVSGYLQLVGAIVNMQDITSYWGILGISPQAAFTLVQYGSQFQVAGMLMSAANAPTAAQIAATAYFIKFYPDYIGKNQVQGVLYNTATTATPASGLLKVLWADTTSFIIETTETNMASFPVAYSPGYGLRNYMYGVNYDSVNRPWNVNSSREI